MTPSLHFAFFSSSPVSSDWSDSAMYYRGIMRALAERGHEITFYEPHAFARQRRHDAPATPWADVVVYPGEDEGAALRCVERATRTADVLVKANGAAACDRLLDDAVARAARPGQTTIFWDVDAASTLEQMRLDPHDPFRGQVARYDMVLTYDGGERLVRQYERFGARACIPIYDALDPETHFPVERDARFEAKLGLLAHRRLDREARIDRFFFKAAEKLPATDFLLGGAGWSDASTPPNVRVIGHVSPADHNAFNVTPRAVLDVARESTATGGFSPGARVFQTAGAAACLITDNWEGIETFLEPGREVLVAEDGDHVASILSSLSADRARIIGANARRRILAHHTYADRALELESILLIRARAASRLSA